MIECVLTTRRIADVLVASQQDFPQDTLGGLEELDYFLDAVEKLAVTSLHVFMENQVLNLPKEINLELVQVVIVVARLVCPLLLEFKRDAKVFFLPKLQNVEVLSYQLDRYIQTTQEICENFKQRNGISLAKGSESKMSQFIRARAALWSSEMDSWKKIHDSLCEGAGKVVAQDDKALGIVSRVASDIPGIGQAAVKGSLALSKSARVGFIAVNALFLGMDIFFICKDSISLAKGSETEVSQFIRARAALWSSEMDSWKKIHDSLCEEGSEAMENILMVPLPKKSRPSDNKD
ncbi:hypothetical protein L3Q82_013901 [Scortum barcoo]|uniref:Uncharacterized protein n=1 Tax=Scortum barcoo TaxID=214431 RepID=A0ACB8VVH3_9TELE|nr:hypothetical protein L3Q82_013901 [Scortum barcoo]